MSMRGDGPGALTAGEVSGSPLYAMTHLKNTYGLKAIPTEKILKEFRPARGMVITTSIHVPPADRTILQQMEESSWTDPKAWKGGKVLVDAKPIIARIATEMGYDLSLLTEGEGETGVAGHSWTTYADDGECPMLVRWEAGEARLLLCIGLPMLTGRFTLQTTREAYVVILGDKAAADIMKRVGLALEGLADGLKPCDAEIAVGNTLRKVKMEECGHYFDYQCRMTIDASKGPNTVRRVDYLELMHSVGLWIDDVNKPRARHVFRDMDLELDPGRARLSDSMEVSHLRDRKMRFTYDPEQPLSSEIRELIHRQSVSDARSMMDFILQKSVMPERDEIINGAGEFPEETEPVVDMELEERKLRHRRLCEEVDGFPQRQDFSRMHVRPLTDLFGDRMPTLGKEFRHLPKHILRGSGANLAMKGGHLASSWDLLDFLFAQFAEMPKRFPAKGEGRGGLTLTARVIAPSIAEQYRDQAAVNHQIVPITNPFYAMHKGLPVRVDKSLTLWRLNDEDAMAADFFYAPETRDLHIANLYRVKVPKA